MKKILLLGLLFIGMNCFAQGTTQKEYNYASKGYAEDLANNKGVITGYEVKKISMAVTAITENNKPVEVKTTIYKLIRTENNTVAAIIVREKRVGSTNEVFTCLPNSTADEKIWKLASDDYFVKVKQYKCSSVGIEFTTTFNVLKNLAFILSN